MSKRSNGGVQGIIDRIFALKAEIAAKETELAGLVSRLQVQDEKPEPIGFDYRAAILDVFSQNPTASLSIDDVVRGVSSKYGFSVRKDTITNRMNYLADRDHALERVEGRRGFYRIPVKETPAVPSTGG